MRRTCTLITIVLAVAACDRNKLPPAEVSPGIEALGSSEDEGCPDDACEQQCAAVDEELQKDCPAAYEAGCFDGTAPEDYPCEQFVAGGEVDRPEADGAPAVKAAKQSEEEGADGETTGAKSTPIGD